MGAPSPILTPEDIDHLSLAEINALIFDWTLWARPSQLPPDHPDSPHYNPDPFSPTYSLRWEYWLAIAGRGFGKALDITTLIPTPKGLTPLSQIQTGDLVYAPDGTATRVLAAHPPQFNRPCYRVQFDNGQSVIADEEHLWATIPREQRRRPKDRFKSIHTTKEIRDSLRVGSTVNHFIPSTQPLSQPLSELPIDPYLLGYWLGDGSSKSWRFTILKDDLSHFESKLQPGITAQVRQDQSPHCWDVKLSNGTPIQRNTQGQYESNDSLQSQLRYLNIHKNKHIPLQYFLSSVSQRMELLRGLMDSDGSVNKRGNQASFYSTKSRLANDVYYLMSSMGYVVSRSIKYPKITGKPEAICQPCHILRIRPRRELNPFSLPRKRDRVAPTYTQSSRLSGRFITSITPTPTTPVRCLTVEHPSKLYLITPDCIPTHNTRLGAEQVLRWVDQGYRRIAIISPTTADTRDVAVEGEALALDTLVPTPKGWITVQDLQVNDRVFAPDGSVTQIIAVSPIWKDRPTIRIKPKLSAPIIADHAHQWITQSKNDRRQNYSASIRTSKEVSQTLTMGSKLNHSIALPFPLQLPELQLPIPPYTLGAWLGDGDTRAQGSFCQHPDDQSTVDRIRKDGFEVRKHRAQYSWGIQGIGHLLNSLNLKHNKHIPPIYLRASISQRLALVQGLMDTDGNVSKTKGQCQFSNTNLRIVEGLRELLLTLGFKPGEIQLRPQSRSSLATKDGYRLSFFVLPHTPNPFHMPRKAQYAIPRAITSDSNYRLIEEATPHTSQDTKCIQVEHPSHTFLVGRDFVPTHNSGILNIASPSKRPIYEPSKRRLTFPSGAIATLYSAEEPERLRGPQHDAAWLDELAAWQYAQEVWDQLHFGLRLGSHPQVVVSTTPKPTPLVRSLVERAQKPNSKIFLSSGSTYENRANLAPIFFTQVEQYEGTRLGRQELHAELIDPKEMGIIKESWFQLFPHHLALPRFELVIQSYDTAFTEKTLDTKTKEPDPSAASTYGIFALTPALRTALNIPATHTHLRYAALLLDAWTEHMEFPTLRTKVLDEYNTSLYGPPDDQRKADIVLIEDKGSGISLRQELQTIVPVRAFNPGKADKVQRLHVVSHIPCKGLIFLPESSLPNKQGQACSWCKPFVDQVCTFPDTLHDDFVDTFSQALLYAKAEGYLLIDPPEERDDYVDEDDSTRQRHHNPYAA